MTQHDPAWWRTHLQLTEEEATRTRVCAQRGGMDLQVLSLAQQMHNPFEEFKRRRDSSLSVYQRTIAFCEMAREGGWSGSWDKDIARLEKKAAARKSRA